MISNQDPNLFVIVGIRRNIKNSISHEALFNVRIQYSSQTNDVINQRAYLISNELVDEQILDIEGNTYEIISKTETSSYPKGLIGLFSDDTEKLPDEGNYRARIWMTKDISAHYCWLTPLFESLRFETNPDIAYSLLIHKLMDLYTLSEPKTELPRKRNNQEGLMISTPTSVFINYPQRPKWFTESFLKERSDN